MSEDKAKQLQQDEAIDIENAEDLKGWSQFFGVEEGTLAAAVKFVGSSSQKVKKFLGK